MTTFNPPYNLNYDFNDDMESAPTETYTDKDGKVVLKSEVEAYGASIPTEAPPSQP